MLDIIGRLYNVCTVLCQVARTVQTLIYLSGLCIDLVNTFITHSLQVTVTQERIADGYWSSLYKQLSSLRGEYILLIALINHSDRVDRNMRICSFTNELSMLSICPRYIYAYIFTKPFPLVKQIETNNRQPVPNSTESTL